MHILLYLYRPRLHHFAHSFLLRCNESVYVHADSFPTLAHKHTLIYTRLQVHKEVFTEEFCAAKGWNDWDVRSWRDLTLKPSIILTDMPDYFQVMVQNMLFFCAVVCGRVCGRAVEDCTARDVITAVVGIDTPPCLWHRFRHTFLYLHKTLCNTEHEDSGAACAHGEEAPLAHQHLAVQAKQHLLRSGRSCVCRHHRRSGCRHRCRLQYRR